MPTRIGSCVVALALAAGLACNDPRDAQVPLIPEVAPARPVPTLAPAPVQAFANLVVRSGADAGAAPCPVQFASVLGASCERGASGGACGAVRDGEGALVQCVLRPRGDASGIYDVDLLIEHERLPRLAVRGPMHEAQMTRVALLVTTPERQELGADCDGAAISLEPAAVYFQLAACAGQVDGMGAMGCAVALTAGFENCGL